MDWRRLSVTMIIIGVCVIVSQASVAKVDPGRAQENKCFRNGSTKVKAMNRSMGKKTVMMVQEEDEETPGASSSHENMEAPMEPEVTVGTIPEETEEMVVPGNTGQERTETEAVNEECKCKPSQSLKEFIKDCDDIIEHCYGPWFLLLRPERTPRLKRGTITESHKDVLQECRKNVLSYLDIFLGPLGQVTFDSRVMCDMILKSFCDDKGNMIVNQNTLVNVKLFLRRKQIMTNALRTLLSKEMDEKLRATDVEQVGNLEQMLNMMLEEGSPEFEGDLGVTFGEVRERNEYSRRLASVKKSITRHRERCPKCNCKQDPLKTTPITRTLIVKNACPDMSKTHEAIVKAGLWGLSEQTYVEANKRIVKTVDRISNGDMSALVEERAPIRFETNLIMSFLGSNKPLQTLYHNLGQMHQHKISGKVSKMQLKLIAYIFQPIVGTLFNECITHSKNNISEVTGPNGEANIRKYREIMGLNEKDPLGTINMNKPASKGALCVSMLYNMEAGSTDPNGLHRTERYHLILKLLTSLTIIEDMLDMEEEEKNKHPFQLYLEALEDIVKAQEEKEIGLRKCIVEMAKEKEQNGHINERNVPEVMAYNTCLVGSRAQLESRRKVMNNRAEVDETEYVWVEPTAETMDAMVQEYLETYESESSWTQRLRELSTYFYQPR